MDIISSVNIAFSGTSCIEVGAVGERITVSVSVFLLVLISNAMSVITFFGNLNIGLQLFISYF